MIPTIEQIVEDVKAGTITTSQAVTWLHQHAEGSANELRDHFAGLAMQGAWSVSGIDFGGTGNIAKIAYEQADAMLAEREKS